jgi:hypothetical protein
LLTYKDLPNEIKVKVEKRLKEIKWVYSFVVNAVV